jgi:poly-gamma-glutamate synthesis protein (capsule biosynthesis protein)
LNLEEAQRPVILETGGKRRVITLSCGHRSGGIPSSWAAAENKPGVYLLRDLSDKTLRDIKELIEKRKRSGDIVVISIHWGGNWGFENPRFPGEIRPWPDR